MESFIGWVLLIVIFVVIVQWVRVRRYLKDPSSNSQNSFGATVNVEYQGPPSPEVQVSEPEIDAAMNRYAFILGDEPKRLTTAKSWFKESNRKSFLKSHPEKALDWILPFLPREIVEIESLTTDINRGPWGLRSVLKNIRALIRTKRRDKEPYQDLLKAMYNTAVLVDFVESLRFGSVQPHAIFEFVTLSDITNVQIDYTTIGLDQLEAPLKTDRRWYVESFGEPDNHLPVVSCFKQVIEGAITRYCWKDFADRNKNRQLFGGATDEITDWLRETLALQIKWEKVVKVEHSARLSRSRPSRGRSSKSSWVNKPVSSIIAATHKPFAVADLETTGLDANQHEITEIAALLVDPDGTITYEFANLVRTDNSVPRRITDLTGIDDRILRKEGGPLKEALLEFLNQTQGRPVFFHHAPFDKGFLDAACERCGLEFNNDVYDTIPLARKAWPFMQDYKLGSLADYLQLDKPDHRAFQDSRTTLGLLLAARKVIDQ